MSQFQQEFVTTAIEHYGLELDDQRVDTVISTWFQTYDPAWVVKALVEALYRGRYKVKSVDNILRDWQRRGSPLYKFTPDYEREILQSLRLSTDGPVTLLPSAIPTPVDISVRQIAAGTPPLPDPKRLDPEETAPFQHHDRSSLAARPASEVDPKSSSTQPKLTEIDRPSPAPNRSSLPSLPDRFSLERNHSVSPMKLHLFHKLREIVEPTNLHHQSIRQSVW
jgi:hypothetical protein